MPPAILKDELPDSPMTNKALNKLAENVGALLGDSVLAQNIRLDELTLDVEAGAIKSVCEKLRDKADFDQLTDLCGMDYSGYGAEDGEAWQGHRYAVIYHLLSFDNNIRLRLRAQLSESQLVIDSVIDVWAGADWFERETFDLFGIIFNGHPDLRRLLTDYGFIGHPFRKDFPLSGQVEMRFDEEQGRVIYQPVTIEPRILVPRIIRKDVFANTVPEQSAPEDNA